MKYMKVNADWVSGKENAALVQAVNGSLVPVFGSPSQAREGQAFCICESVEAGICQGTCWLPLNDSIMDGYVGTGINGVKSLISSEGKKIFDSFEEAQRDALMDSPIATATTHLRSFLFSFMDDGEQTGLSIPQLDELLDLACNSDIEENMLNSWGYSIDGGMDVEVAKIVRPEQPGQK